MPISVQQLIQQHPEVGAALQFHKQRQGNALPQPHPQVQLQGQPQQQPQMQKPPTPPDMQERMIILNALAGHLKVLDSVIKPPQPKQAPGQPPPGLVQMAQNAPQGPQGGLPNVG